MKKRAMTAEDRAIYKARVGKVAKRTYARGHAVDAAATDLWVHRAAYLDIARRVRCLAVPESYWEIVNRARKRRGVNTH